MRSGTVRLMLLVIALALLCQPAGALTIFNIPYVRAGPVFSLAPFQTADLFIVEANTSSLAAAHSGAFALSFGPGTASGPGLSFAEPALAQTTSDTLVCAQTYFYRDSEEV